MGVIIQSMVQSDVSGVIFTINPVTKNRNELVIEATYGLGEELVQGRITPDSYVVNRKTGVVTKNIVEKTTMLIQSDDETRLAEVPIHKREAATLTDAQIKRISGIARNLKSCSINRRILNLQFKTMFCISFRQDQLRQYRAQVPTVNYTLKFDLLKGKPI